MHFRSPNSIPHKNMVKRSNDHIENVVYVLNLVTAESHFIIHLCIFLGEKNTIFSK